MRPRPQQAVAANASSPAANHKWICNQVSRLGVWGSWLQVRFSVFCFSLVARRPARKVSNYNKAITIIVAIAIVIVAVIVIVIIMVSSSSSFSSVADYDSEYGCRALRSPCGLCTYRRIASWVAVLTTIVAPFTLCLSSTAELRG